jgi:hypothetical protein
MPPRRTPVGPCEIDRVSLVIPLSWVRDALVDNFSLTPFVTLRDVLQAIRGMIELPDVSASDLGVLGEVARWTVDYLCRAHPQLGRSGDVCPFTEVALREGLLFSAVCHLFDADPRPGMERAMAQALHDYESRPPKMGNRVGLKATLVLFPSIEPEWVEYVQEQLSLSFAQRGLMLGEFHAESLVPGLHNTDFHPLRSPVPLLGMRAMMLTDLPFLRGTDEKLACYLDRFGDAALNAISLHLRSPDTFPPDVLARLERALHEVH